MSGFGSVVRDARMAAGWSQQRAAAAAGCTAGSYANIESGCGSPLCVDNILRLAKAMGCSPAPLLEERAMHDAARFSRRWPLSKRGQRELAALLVREAKGRHPR